MDTSHLDLPIIDFSTYSWDREESPSDGELIQIAEEIRTALDKIVVFRVKNTGISIEKVGLFG